VRARRSELHRSNGIDLLLEGLQHDDEHVCGRAA
jgi:hypothetical protein